MAAIGYKSASFGSIDDATFTHNSVNYTITGVEYISSVTELEIYFSGGPTSDPLCVFDYTSDTECPTKFAVSLTVGTETAILSGVSGRTNGYSVTGVAVAPFSSSDTGYRRFADNTTNGDSEFQSGFNFGKRVQQYFYGNSRSIAGLCQCIYCYAFRNE